MRIFFLLRFQNFLKSMESFPILFFVTHEKILAPNCKIKEVIKMDDFAVYPPQFYPLHPHHAVLFQVRL